MFLLKSMYSADCNSMSPLSMEPISLFECKSSWRSSLSFSKPLGIMPVKLLMTGSGKSGVAGQSGHWEFVHQLVFVFTWLLLIPDLPKNKFNERPAKRIMNTGFQVLASAKIVLNRPQLVQDREPKPSTPFNSKNVLFPVTYG